MPSRNWWHPRDRMLGARLRAVRTERAGLFLEDAARMLGTSTATLSRTENGLRHITSDEVATIVIAYGPPGRGAGRVHRRRTMGRPVVCLGPPPARPAPRHRVRQLLRGCADAH